MADFNKRLASIQSKSDKLKEDLTSLLRDYDGLFHEANGIYLNQRMATGNEGLEDFYRLLQVIRRNKDLTGSLLRGFGSVRPTAQFKFIEDDLPQEVKKSPAQIRRQRKAQQEASPEDLRDIQAPDTVREPEEINR